MTRRSYAGGANLLTLAAGFAPGDPTFVTDAPIGWPDGSGGPFAVRVGKGQPTEEKLLITSRSGSTFTISQHGYDGTAANSHSAGLPDGSVELVGTSIDLDEANAHVNASLMVHGLASGVKVLGDINVATVKGKSLSGADNTFTLIPRLASPEIDAKLTAIDSANAVQDTSIANRYTKSETDALISTETVARTTADTAEATARAAADTAETTRATAAEALKAPIASPTFTGTVTLPGDATLPLQAMTKQQFDAAIIDWTSYTPALSGTSGGSPALGNGSIIGQYRKIEHSVLVQVEFTVGSTSNLGTGNFQISLPFAAFAAVPGHIGTASIVDFTPVGRYVGVVWLQGVNNCVIILADGTVVSGQASNPIVFASGDIIRYAFEYRAA